jgi:predicted enzyme related to lactoylglutathione lyase
MSDSGNQSAMPPPGAITWTEIPVTNISRAQKFYEDVFNWTYTPMPSVCKETGKKLDEPPVVLFVKGPSHGSLVKVSEEDHLSPAKHPQNPEKSKLSVRVTITVESIDDTMKLVEKAGGELYKPKEAIPDNMGFVAYFVDTERNVMGLWSMI